MIALIHEHPWQLLRERMNAVVAQEPALAPARALVEAPVVLLAALSEDVEAALANDRLALDRLRVLLSTSAVHTPPLSAMRALISPAGGASSGALTMIAHDARDLPDTAILDAGGLVLAGLAASRAGAEVGLPQAFVDHVLGLALAATPAETLGRALGSGLTDSQLRAALSGLLPTDRGDRRLSMALVSFVADPSERARWRALDSLLALVSAGKPPVMWEGAISEGIISVTPAAACPGSSIEIRVRLAPHSAATSHVGDLLADIDKGTAHVVFASTAGPAVAAAADSVDQTGGSIKVTVPAGVNAGWIGVTAATLVNASNQSRAALRAFWKKQNGQHPALRHMPVPVDRIAALPAVPAPPRNAGAQFAGGLPVIELIALEPAMVEGGGTATLRWRVLGARTVDVDPAPGKAPSSGAVRLDVPHGASSITARVTATNACGQTIATAHARARVRLDDVRVVLSGSALPPHEGAPATVSARLSSVPKGVHAQLAAGAIAQAMVRDGDVVSAELPASAVVDRLAGRVRVFVDRDKPDDEQSFGPLQISAPARRRLVVVRPVVLAPTFGRVSAADADEAVMRAGRTLGVQFEAVTAPWIEDAGLTVDGTPGGAETPATRRLLERLNVMAAATSGFEDAVWVALVPGANLRVAVAQGANAAVGVVVSSVSMLAEALRHPPAALAPATDRLCLFGTLDSHGEVRLREVRRRHQAAGGGGPIKTGLSVLGVDRAGRDICAVPISLQSNILPAPFVALLPMSPEIARVEVRVIDLADVIDIKRFRPDPASEGQWVARRIDRVVGEPALSNVRVSRGTMRWEYAHGRGARPIVTIELGRHGGWWPIRQAGACTSSAGLALERLAPATRKDRVRVVATDGWHTVASTALPAAPVKPRPVVVRYAGGRRFWADLNSVTGDPSWRIGTMQRKGPVVTVPDGYDGPVHLLVDTGTRVLKDERRIDTQGAVDGIHIW